MPKRSLFSEAARTSLSSLLRGGSVALVDRSSAGNPDSMPRVFGARVLRGDNVGIRRPVSVSVPSIRALEGAEELVLEEAQKAAPPPPDFAEIEEAARRQGYN